MKRHAIATAILICTCPLFFSPYVSAQNATLIGSVKNTQIPLSNALIHIMGTDINTATNRQGEFELPKLNAGLYQLKITSQGYESQVIDISITDNKVKQLKPFILTATLNANTIEEIIAVGHIQRGEIAAASRQKNAHSIKNVISADGIGKLPDRNAAEAVQRISGVSIERDQGEGRFVAVRGLPAQWSSASINGNRLPTAEEETTSRATAFDFFPSELIESVEVSKALTPDIEGDAIGGNVNFITKKAPDDFILNSNIAIGTNDLVQGTNYSANVLYGDRLLDDKLGFLINATAWQRDWATDNYEARRGSDGLGIYRLELRDYTGNRETYGLNGALEYQLINGSLSATAMYGTLIDDETQYKHRFRFDEDRAEIQHIRNELITEMTGLEFAGEHYFGYDKTLNWKLSSYENEFRYGNTPNDEDNSYFVTRFDQNNIGYQGLENRNTGNNYAYNRIDGGSDPWNAISNHLPEQFAFDPAKSQLASVQLYKIYVNEKDRLVASTDFEWQLNNDLIIKVGAKYRDKQRVARFSDEFYNWDEANYGVAPSLNNFALTAQPGSKDYLNELNTNYQNQFSPVASTDDLAQFWNKNKHKFILDKTESALIENGAALGRNFDVSEQHSSLYGMATFTFNNQWDMVTGLRLTQTDTQVDGYTYLADENTVIPSSANNHYLSVLPALHLTYRSDEQTNYRLALTRSFSRPDFGSLTPGATYLEADNKLISGNPELAPTYSNNLDLMAEYFFEHIGLVSAGVFYKDISNPIFQSSSIGEFANNSSVNIIRPENGDNAWLAGVEIAFNRDLKFISPALKNFGLMTNATLMDSKMRVPGRQDAVSISRQANNLYNFSVYFDDTLFAARLAINYKGAYVEEHGSNPQSDSYYSDNTSVDFSTSYQLNNNALVYLELNNLTNEPLTYYLGDKHRPLQVEYYGVRGMVGINYQF